ncbi:MAG: YdcF family protein [Bacillota bacterium]|nr:YdcF family protein [Bacillota bacterium]
MNNQIVLKMLGDINNIIKFLSKRDINELSSSELCNKFGIKQADMIIILGNSMPYIARLGAVAYKNGLSKNLMIVGGIGHSTKYLIENVLEENKYISIDVNNKSEAEILAQIISLEENIDKEKIIIESNSTNCGSNAYEAYDVLRRRGEIPKSIILIQDPTMQLRSHASFLKAWDKEDTLIISYAPFIPEVKETKNGFIFLNTDVKGIWSNERFMDLIMGEIPRLKDDENGYGPKGKGFISHVNIPEEVLVSYENLISHYSEYNEIRFRK